jgi:hypothetical protein
MMAASSADAGTWVPANVPAGGTGMTVFGINDHNDITGAYTNSSGVIEGLIGPFDGSNYTSFTDSGSATTPRALNDRDDVTGFDAGTLVPWERLHNGTLANITKAGVPLNEIAQGINRTGTFAGNFDNAQGDSRGYLGRRLKFRTKFHLSIPNAGWAGRAINDLGWIGGWYVDPNTGLQRGFVKRGNQNLFINYPGSKTAYTVVEGLNNKGEVSGQWEDTSGVIHGFVYDINKGKHSYQSLDAPGASFTQVWGINNNDVVAVSADVSNATQSFAYCMRAANCPGSTGHVFNTPPNRSGKPPKPAPN